MITIKRGGLFWRYLTFVHNPQPIPDNLCGLFWKTLLFTMFLGVVCIGFPIGVLAVVSMAYWHLLISAPLLVLYGTAFGIALVGVLMMTSNSKKVKRLGWAIGDASARVSGVTFSLPPFQFLGWMKHNLCPKVEIKD